MFISHPQYEFPVPKGLANPGAQHWRLIELALHAPWFLLTVDELCDEGEGEGAVSLTRTLCIAWERDLVHMLGITDVRQIRGLVCMTPGWASKAEQWVSREIEKVWLIRTEDAQEYVRLLGADAEEFDGCLHPDPCAKVVERRELLHLKPRRTPNARGLS